MNIYELKRSGEYTNEPASLTITCRTPALRGHFVLSGFCCSQDPPALPSCSPRFPVGGIRLRFPPTRGARRAAVVPSQQCPVLG